MTQSTHMMSDGTEDIGWEAIVHGLQSFYRAGFESKVESTNTVFGDGRAFTEGNLVNRHIDVSAGITATGEEVRVSMCVSYDAGNGQIQCPRVCFLMASLLNNWAWAERLINLATGSATPTYGSKNHPGPAVRRVCHTR